MTVLDVGANVGYTAILMARCVGPSGLVVALEPEPLNFELLCANLSRHSVTNVLPIHSAAGERTGSITLQRSPDNSGDHRTAPHPFGIASIDVPMVAIDDLVPADLSIDFVFTDAQGYDHRVVQGMRQTIDRNHPAVLVEFWPPGIAGLDEDADDVLQLYRSLGYRTELLPDIDASALSAREIVDLGGNGKDHVTLSLVPGG